MDGLSFSYPSTVTPLQRMRMPIFDLNQLTWWKGEWRLLHTGTAVSVHARRKTQLSETGPGKHSGMTTTYKEARDPTEIQRVIRGSGAAGMQEGLLSQISRDISPAYGMQSMET